MLDGLSAELVLPILAKALSCGLVVWLLVKSVDGAPPPLTAWVISLPMVIGAGFLAIAGRQSDAFLVEAALRGAQSLPSALAFMVVSALLFDRCGVVPLLLAALAGWFVVIWACTLSAAPWPLETSLALGAAMIAASHLLLPIHAGFVGRIAGQGRRRAAWPVAVQAGVMVLMLSAFAQVLGPKFSAWLTAVPLATGFVTIGMKRGNSRNAAATYQSARLGLPCLYAYLAAVVVLTPLTGGAAATLLAFLPSLALSALIVAARLTLTAKETAR